MMKEEMFENEKVDKVEEEPTTELNHNQVQFSLNPKSSDQLIDKGNTFTSF